MKHLKTYENSREDAPDFKEGDYVICIDGDNSVLTKSMRYLVKRIFKNYHGKYVCKVNSKLGKIGENLGTFTCNRFIDELKYTTKKFNL